MRSCSSFEDTFALACTYHVSTAPTQLLMLRNNCLFHALVQSDLAYLNKKKEEVGPIALFPAA